MRVNFLTGMAVAEISEGAWQLERPFLANVTDGKKNIFIGIDAEFVTDFCSVPRMPFAYLLYGGVGNRAGLVHDALYSSWPGVLVYEAGKNEPITYQYSRAWADDVLMAALQECGIGFIRRRMMFWGVRVFGASLFKKGVKA